MVNAPSELMLKAQALMKQKDELEVEIKKQQDDLQSVNWQTVCSGGGSTLRCWQDGASPTDPHPFVYIFFILFLFCSKKSG